MSAIEENASKDRKQFYETVYKLTNALLAGIIVCIIAGIKPLYLLVMDEKFASAWVFAPILCIATAFNCQASFFGVVYTTSEKTNKAFGTTALGAIANVAFNFILIKPLGLHGVALGTCLGYIVVALVRARDVKKEINMDFDTIRTVTVIIIMTIQSLVTISAGNIGIALAGGISIFAVLILYRKEVLEILNIGLSLIRKKG